MSPPTLVEGAGAVMLVLAACGACYGVVATWATWRFSRRPRPTGVRHPSISVLKPMHGLEPALRENLSSFCEQDYGGAVQLILGVQDPADPALAVARRVQAEHTGMDITIVADATPHGANRKVGNLINMAAHATGELIAISDSDVRMPRDGLRQIATALEPPDVGMIYCVYRGQPTASGWSQLAAMDNNFRFIPSALVGEALGAAVCLGPTMALRADTLRAVGGVERLAGVLADDFELGRAVRATGRRVTCPPLIIDHVFPEASAREMLVHELRWARTIRLVEPAGYVATAITHVFALALIGAALMGFPGWSLILLVAICAARIIQAAVVGALLSMDRRRLWLLPLRDLLSFGVFVVGLFGQRVEWRGHRLRANRDGAIAAW